MKPRFALLLGLLTFARVALAQVSSLPHCAQSCANSSFGSSNNSSGCNSIDVACICSSQAILGSLACCITAACSTSDTNSAVDFLDNLCSATGVTVPRILICNNSTTVTRTPTGSPTTSSGTTATAAAATTTTSTSAGPNPTAAADGGNQGLDPGAKAGIGVGVAVGGLLVLAAVAFLLYRRRRRGTATPIGSELPDTQRFEKDGMQAQRYEKDGVEVQPWRPPPQEMPTGPPERFGELAG